MGAMEYRSLGSSAVEISLIGLGGGGLRLAPDWGGEQGRRADGEGEVPARGIQHVDLAVGEVERSIAFYSALLGPLGLKEKYRLTSYRGTEEVVYLEFAAQGLGLRPADGGSHRHYGVGIEH